MTVFAENGKRNLPRNLRQVPLSVSKKLFATLKLLEEIFDFLKKF